MKFKLQHAVYGVIDYEENFWTGKKEIFVNGTKLEKRDKTTFWMNMGAEEIVIRVQGGFLTGVSLLIGGEVLPVTPKSKWYELVCSAAIFVLILIWGNNPALCSILPIVGGAIGGAISGLAACVNLLAMRSAKSAVTKLFVWIGITAATVLVCLLIGMGIVMLFS